MSGFTTIEVQLGSSYLDDLVSLLGVIAKESHPTGDPHRLVKFIFTQSLQSKALETIDEVKKNLLVENKHLRYLWNRSLKTSSVMNSETAKTKARYRT